MKPVLKWAGGKTQLLGELLPMIPEFNTYYEVFFGGGALFFALEPKNSIINDFNPQLINLYTVIRDNEKKFRYKLNELQREHSDENYYLVRNKFNNCLKKNKLTITSAAYMLYLNKMGFNGLYRLNADGLYNVPSAKKTKCVLYDTENVKTISKMLKNSTILNVDFEKACETAKKGDFVFFDSPYYNTFDTYQAGGFSESDHKRLAELFKRLTEKGVKCLLTNSDEPFIKNLYSDFNIKIVDVKRMINCDGNKRTGKEVIISNY